MKKVIIYGTGLDAGDCVDFFGKENVLHLVQDARPKDGVLCHGCKVMAFSEFASTYQFDHTCIDTNFDIIVAIRITNIGGILSMAGKLKKIGCNFSIWQDVKKRWTTSAAFLKRDMAVYPYERESLFEIGNAQFEYLVKHTDPTTLLPATGPLRESQLEALRLSKSFQAEMEDDGINFCMMGGTLIGACRHKGFIPWDIDLDFALLQPGFDKFIEKLEAREDTQCFHLFDYDRTYQPGTPIFKTLSGSTTLDSNMKYFCRVGYGYIKIFLNTGKATLKENKLVCDVFPLYQFSDDYRDADYQQDLQFYFQNRSTNGIDLYREYASTMKQRGAIVETGNKIGFGHPFLSSMMTWFPAFWHTFKLLPTSEYLPLQKIEFEDTYFLGPSNPQAFLEMVNYKNFQQLPKTMPFDHHRSSKVINLPSLHMALKYLEKEFD